MSQINENHSLDQDLELDVVLDELLTDKYHDPRMVKIAHRVLKESDQSEEDFLGAQGVLLLNGLL